jgi:hypothetical protein
MMKNKLFSLAAVVLMLGSSAAPALAYQQRPYYGYNNYNSNYYRSNSNYNNYKDYQRRQYTQKALIGAAAGAVLGGVMGSGNGETAGGAIKGALLGTGAGLGYEYIKQKGWF